MGPFRSDEANIFVEIRSPVPGWFQSLEVGKTYEASRKKLPIDSLLVLFSFTKPMALYLVNGHIVLGYKIICSAKPMADSVSETTKTYRTGFFGPKNNFMRQDDMARYKANIGLVKENRKSKESIGKFFF